MMLAITVFQVDWPRYFPQLLQGLARTLEYTLASFIGAAILGLVLALLRLSPHVC
jgi:ABC-type amino acid transport system permease subunit